MNYIILYKTFDFCLLLLPFPLYLCTPLSSSMDEVTVELRLLFLLILLSPLDRASLV